MGKLHSIKRSIKNNSDLWKKYIGVKTAAEKRDGKWIPVRYWYRENSFNKFIQHVLKSNGGL